LGAVPARTTVRRPARSMFVGGPCRLSCHRWPFPAPRKHGHRDSSRRDTCMCPREKRPALPLALARVKPEVARGFGAGYKPRLRRLPSPCARRKVVAAGARSLLPPARPPDQTTPGRLDHATRLLPCLLSAVGPHHIRGASFIHHFLLLPDHTPQQLRALHTPSMFRSNPVSPIKGRRRPLLLS
jgi:hypothetical protein